MAVQFKTVLTTEPQIPLYNNHLSKITNNIGFFFFENPNENASVHCKVCTLLTIKVCLNLDYRDS